jgi:hypothetical protein
VDIKRIGTMELTRVYLKKTRDSIPYRMIEVEANEDRTKFYVKNAFLYQEKAKQILLLPIRAFLLVFALKLFHRCNFFL